MRERRGATFVETRLRPAFEACEQMVGGEDEQAAHDTLCAFRLRDDHDRGLKLNSEPAPPNTMLDSDLLDKLVKRTRRTLDSHAGGAAATAAHEEAGAHLGGTAAEGDAEAPKKASSVSVHPVLPGGGES